MYLFFLRGHTHMMSLNQMGGGVHQIVTLSDERGGGVLRKVTSPKNEYNNLTSMHSKSTIQWRRDLIFFSTEYWFSQAWSAELQWWPKCI